MSNSDNLSNVGHVGIDYDRDELEAQLDRAAAEIDEEIRSLEEATAVTREVLQLEFTV